MQCYLAGMQEKELEDILCGLMGWERGHSLATIYCALHPERKQVLIRHIMQRLSYSSIAFSFAAGRTAALRTTPEDLRPAIPADLLRVPDRRLSRGQRQSAAAKKRRIKCDSGIR